MESRIDLEAAAELIEDRRAEWTQLGITASETTWRDQGRGWPPHLVTERRQATDPDSVGVVLRKDAQEGSVVLFAGGWADYVFWDGESPTATDEAPGWDDWLDLDRFGRLLDRLTASFT